MIVVSYYLVCGVSLSSNSETFISLLPLFLQTVSFSCNSEIFIYCCSGFCKLSNCLDLKDINFNFNLESILNTKLILLKHNYICQKLILYFLNQL